MKLYCPLTGEKLVQLSKGMIRKISILLRKNFIGFLPLSGSNTETLLKHKMAV